MAPTETLATQHLLGISALCEPLGVRVTQLVNGMPARERRAALGVSSPASRRSWWARTR